MKKLQRVVSLVLVLVLLVGFVPAAFAAETEPTSASQTVPSGSDPPETGAATTPPDATTPSTETTLPGDTPTQPEETDPPDTTAPPEAPQPSTEATLPPEGDPPAEEAAGLATPAAPKASATYWELTMAGYYGLEVTFPWNGGTYTNRDNLVLRGVDIDRNQRASLREAAYCVQPTLPVNSSQYNETEVTGVEEAWGKLDKGKQRAVSLALLYGAPNGLWSDNSKTELTYQLATAIVIEEICIGWRDSLSPYACNNSTYIDTFNDPRLEFYGGIYTSVAGKVNLDELMYAYNFISGKMAKHGLTLSFASRRPDISPIHNMTALGDGRYQVTLTDANGVLEQYAFTSSGGMTYSTTGNTLTVTASSAASIPADPVAPTRNMPSAENSGYLIWNSGSGSSQQLVSVGTARNDPVPAYFKLQAPNGSILVQKTTNTGQNLSGWQFGIYSDSGCTKQVATVTTGSNGQGTLENLAPGVYYAKELSGGDGYWALAPGVKPVTVTAGETATVTFSNTHYGRVKIVKTLEGEGSLAGWRFRMTDSSGKEVAGSPFTSAADGAIATGNLLPGQYTVEELLPADSLYYCKSENPQTIQVKPGETATVTFTNALRPGKISILKVDPLGNPLAGAKFLLEWSADGVSWRPVTASSAITQGGCASDGLTEGCLVSGQDGLVSFDGLHPALFYRLTEVEAPNGYLLLPDAAWEGLLPTEDLTVELTVHNSPGYTLPNTGEWGAILLPLAGALLMTAAILGLAGKNKRKEPTI